MKKIIISLLALLLIAGTATMAQVAINTDNSDADASAILDLKSTDKGFLPPRMTQAERDAIDDPAEGLIIFNTTTNCLNFFVGPDWFEACGEALPLPAALGNSFTSFSNGAPSNENFSANSTCANELISAGHSIHTCSGTVTTPNATYNMVLINGQCWMLEDLKEPSTAPCGDAINTGCNIWLATSPGPGDMGYWGYYNTATPNGSAGWATSEPSPGEGLLYQWSAAMNGSPGERTQGVCPDGWHIPSDCEWMYLEHGLGMSIADQQSLNMRNSGTIAPKMSAFIGDGNNSSGFSILLKGNRLPTGSFLNRDTGRGYWASSDVINRRHTSNTSDGLGRVSSVKDVALSVRCIKD